MKAEWYSSEQLSDRVLFYMNEQKRNLDRFRDYIGLVGGNDVNVEGTQERPKCSEEGSTNVLAGIYGLAKHLGCGINKAQDICNSGILKNQGIQYAVGKKWLFNKSKLEAYLSDNPEVFARVRRWGKSPHISELKF